MAWQLLITISIAAGVSATLFHRVLLKNTEHDTSGFAILSGLLSAAWIALFLLFSGFDTNIGQLPWLNVGLMVLLWSANDIVLNKAVKLNESSVFSILFATRAFWGILAALLFLGESFTSQDWLGALLLGFSVMLAIYRPGGQWRSKPVFYGLLVSFIMGIALTNDGVVLQDGYDVPSYYVFAFLLPALVIGLVVKSGRLAAVAMVRDGTYKRVSVLSFFHAVSAISLFYAFQADQGLSVLTALNQAQTVIAVLAAIILLKEREYMTRKLLGAVLGFVGVLLIVVS